jgi:glutathione peroxidase
MVMKTILGTMLVMGGMAVMMASNVSAQDEKASPAANAKPPLAVDMKTLDGKDVNLAKKYEGKVVMLVNVASKCGFTKQYEQLEALHEKYGEQGLVIIGVPCNQFGGQEPGTAEQIQAFCQANYGVKFDMLAKVDVNGENACELYKFLTSKEKNPKFAGNIKWNFEKFLFDRQGQVIARYASRVVPDAREVTQVIEAELAKKAPAKATTTSTAPSN